VQSFPEENEPRGKKGLHWISSPGQPARPGNGGTHPDYKTKTAKTGEADRMLKWKDESAEGLIDMV